MTKKLLLAGVLLFILGLLNGVCIPIFENQRMGLSAHLAGVQNALVLIVFACIWNYCEFTERVAKWSYGLSIYSMYSIWFALVLAAIWGTSRSTPIAGAGFKGTNSQELVVDVLLYSGSASILVVSFVILVALYQSKNMN